MPDGTAGGRPGDARHGRLPAQQWALLGLFLCELLACAAWLRSLSVSGFPSVFLLVLPAVCAALCVATWPRLWRQAKWRYCGLGGASASLTVRVRHHGDTPVEVTVREHWSLGPWAMLLVMEARRNLPTVLAVCAWQAGSVEYRRLCRAVRTANDKGAGKSV